MMPVMVMVSAMDMSRVMPVVVMAMMSITRIRRDWRECGHHGQGQNGKKSLHDGYRPFRQV
jgi:hypothetical protein